MTPLINQLASQPEVPGVIGSLEQAGTPPDAFVTQNLFFAELNAGLATFAVPILEKLIIEGFDPGPGFGYSLVGDPGSPDFASAALPIDDGAAAWTLTYFTDSGQSGTETSSTGEFDFGPGVDRIDFFALDASGDRFFYPAPFIIDLTFDDTGTFNGTLTTDPGPQASVPEPSSFAILGTALLGLPILRRRRKAQVGDRT